MGKRIISVFYMLICIQFLNAQYLISSNYVGSYNKTILLVFGADYSVDVYKIIYNTKDSRGLPTTASGALMLPVAVCDSFPMLAYSHGTRLNKTDVPSRMNKETFIGSSIAGAGFITLMPDYVGMGDGPGFHPYQHAASEAYANIDMIRAAREFLANKSIKPQNKILLTGYSQGGHASMSTHKMIQDSGLYDEFNIIASCPMSGAYDMSETTAEILLDTVYPFPGFVAYTITSMNNAYGLYNNLSEYYKFPYDTIVNHFITNTDRYTIDEFHEALPDSLKTYMQDSIFNGVQSNPNHPLIEALRKNDVYNWAPQRAVRLLYCPTDERVPQENTLLAVNTMQAQGASSVYTYDGGDHEHIPCLLWNIHSNLTWFKSLVDLTCSYNPVCHEYTNINCGETLLNQTNSGGSSIISSYSCAPSINESGFEKVYKITTTQIGDLTVSISNFTADLDVHILSDCGGDNCLERGDVTATLLNAPIGSYYIVIDGFQGAIGNFDITVNCPGSLPGTCMNPINISCGETKSSDNGNFSNNFSTYNCATFDKDGPEVVFEFLAPATGSITATISNYQKDLRVAILEDCDNNSCVNITGLIGSSITVPVEQGENYYIIVDGADPTDVSSFDLSISCTDTNTLSGVCANPISIVCGQTYTGNNYSSTIGQSVMNSYCTSFGLTGKEVIHQFTNQSIQDVKFVLKNVQGNNFKYAILNSCDAFDCIEEGVVGDTIIISNAPIQDYFIVVDAQNNDSGTYGIEVICEIDTVNPIICSYSTPISCGMTLTNQSTLNGTSFIDYYDCDITKNESGKEKTYIITTTQTSNLFVKIENTTADLDVHILNGCYGNFCLDRGNDSARVNNAPAGVYYIVIDGFQGAQGNFDITVQCEIDSNNTSYSTDSLCTHKIVIPCSDTVIVSSTVGEVNTTNAYGCILTTDESGPEKVYEITTTSIGDLSATLSGMIVDLDIQILSACDSSACLDRGNTNATITNAPIGTYYIVVDGYQGAEGSFTLNITTPCSITPVNNLNCNNAIPLNCGDTIINGTTIGGSREMFVYGGCGNNQKEYGPERVYVINTTSQGDLTASLSNLSLDLDIHILDSCEGNSCVGRGDNIATYINAPAGTYYIIVDGYGDFNTADSGTFTLEINSSCTTINPPPPFDCINSVSISCGQSINGTTLGQNNQVFTYDGCSNLNQSGNESIYKVNLTSISDLNASLSNLNGLNLDVFILDACDTNACLAYGNNTATLTNASPGQYYIIIDGVNGDSGTFTLDVDCIIPNQLLPDLIVTNPTLSTTITSPNGQVNITNIVQNSGQGATTASCQIGYYLSYDNLCDPGDVLLNTSVVGIVNVGGVVNVNSSIVIPNNINVGNYYVIWEIDDANVINELNENNNCTALPLSVQASGYRELIHSNGLSIFPNPFEQSFTIQANIEIDEIVVTDMIGKIVKQNKVGLKTFDVSLSNMQKGTYYIMLRFGEESIIKPIVKQ